MMRAKTIIAVLLALCLALAVAGTWHLFRRNPQGLCPFSGREIHPQTRTWVMIGGRKYETCCVRCAVTEALQTGKRLRVLDVADFQTEKLMKADGAWFVETSTVNLCMSMTPAAMSPTRHDVYLRGFDRCSPSVLAFSSEQEARDFIAKHGGILKRLDDLEQESKPTGQGAKTP